MAQMKAGQAVIEALRAEGVDYTFGVVGTTTNSIVTEMYGRSDIRFVLTRHEQGAAFMAYGYARASGRPGVVTATEGPGITNLATGIAAAYKGFVPLISVCGQQEESIRDREANQDIDQITFMRPITKSATSVY